MSTVGSVSVNVVPDAQGWGARLSAQVLPDAARLGQQIGRLIGDQITGQLRSSIQQGLIQGGAGAGAQGRRQGSDYAGSFADAFRTKLTEAMRALPEIRLHANSSDADVKLASIRAQLDELSSKRIGVDISEDEALTKLAILRERLAELNRDATSIQVKADTTAALARLDEFIARVKEVSGEKAEVKVDVDAGEAEAELAGLEGASGSAAGGFSGLIAAGIALAPALIPVIAAVTAAVVGLLSVLGAGVLGVGVLALGFSGVIKGVQALDQSNKSAAASGRSAASNALQMAGAAQQVEQAERSLANTRANAADAAIRAAEAVKNAKQAERDAHLQASADIQAAERQYNQASAQTTQAVRTETEAQTALVQARKAAAQQLEDLANQVIDNQNATRQAQLDLQSAAANNATVQADPNATSQQKQQAQLTYDEAVQRLHELGVQNQRLADQKAEADAKGVEGSQVVTQAQQQLQQATQGVTDAQKTQALAAANVSKVNADAVKKVAAANQQVTDALRAQAAQQRQAAFSIAQALDAVASAHRAVSSAALGGSVPAVSKLTDEFNKLDPATQAFARFIHDQVEPVFKRIQGAAAKGLLPGVEAGIKILLPVLPGLATFVGQVASALGQMFVQGARALKDPFWTNFFGFVSKNAIPALQGIFQFLLDVAQGFAGIVQAFLPVTTTVGGGLLDLAASFASFGASVASGKNDSFNGFLAYVQQALPAVAGFLGDLIGVIGDVITVFRPWGDLLLSVLDAVAKLIVSLGPTGLAFILAAVGAVVLAIGGPVSILIAAFTALGGGALYIYQNVKPVHEFIDRFLLPKFHELSDYFTGTVLPILEQIGGQALDGIKAGIKTVAGAIEEHKPQLEELYNTFKQAAEYVVEHVLPLLGPILKKAFEAAGVVIGSFVDTIATIVTAFDGIVSAAPGIWDDIHHYFSLGIHDVLQLVHDFIGTLNDVLGHVGVTLPNFNVPGVYEVTHGSRTGGRNIPAANGVVLPGYAPGVDSIHAILSPGEAVMVPEFVRMVGPEWIYAANAAAMRGRRGSGGPQQFGLGGIVNKITGGISDLGSAVAGSVVNPLISTAQSAAHHLVDSALGPGMWRDAANGTIDVLSNAVKLNGGGIAGAAPLSFTNPAGPGVTAADHSRTYHITANSPTAEATARQIRSQLYQHDVLHGAPMLVGT